MNLSIGPGSFPHEDKSQWVDMDLLDLPGIDVVQDAGKFPWPFKNEVFEYVECIDIIEHLDHYTEDRRPTVIAFVEEAHRVLKPSGKLFIQTPHWKSPNCWIDITHVRGFDERSMEYFDPDTPLGRDYGYYSQHKFKTKSTVTENLNVTFSMVKR